MSNYLVDKDTHTAKIDYMEYDLDGYYMFSVNNNELAITDPAIGTMPYANEIEQDGIYSLEYWGINSGSCLLEDI